MSREVVWLPDALNDVARLRIFIMQKNPLAAQRAAQQIKAGAEMLQQNPEAGRPVDELFPFRDLMIPFGAGSYVLRYRLDESKLVIVRVWHSKEERCFQMS